MPPLWYGGSLGLTTANGGIAVRTNEFLRVSSAFPIIESRSAWSVSSG
jgi:hypothetical protein